MRLYQKYIEYHIALGYVCLLKEPVYNASMLQILWSIIKRTKNSIALLITGFIIFTLLRIIPVFKILKSSFGIPNISFSRKWELFNEYVYQSFFDISAVEQSLAILLSLLTALNIILFIIYAKRQKQLLAQKSFIASISGMFLGLFGIGCLSCGVVILAPLITFLGLGVYAGAFIKYALVLASIGIVLVLISNAYLLKKISEPLICDTDSK